MTQPPMPRNIIMAHPGMLQGCIILDFSVNAFLVHGNTVNISKFSKIRVKIAESTLRFMLQLCNDTTSNAEEHNNGTPRHATGLHHIGLLRQRILGTWQYCEHQQIFQNSSKNRRIDVTIYATAL